MFLSCQVLRPIACSINKKIPHDQSKLNLDKEKNKKEHNVEASFRLNEIKVDCIYLMHGLTNSIRAYYLDIAFGE